MGFPPNLAAVSTVSIYKAVPRLALAVLIAVIAHFFIAIAYLIRGAMPLTAAASLLVFLCRLAVRIPLALLRALERVRATIFDAARGQAFIVEATGVINYLLAVITDGWAHAETL